MAKLILRYVMTIAMLFGFNIVLKSQCTVTTSRDTSVCVSHPVIQLQASSSNSIGYFWEPALGLSDSTKANPVARPKTTTNYIVTAVVPDNTELVTNGNFSSGNSGFSSSYSYRSNPVPSSANLLEGQYTIKTNPSSTHQCFANCSDKTSGSGNMMILNGAPNANVEVWSQTISVQANTDYAFSAWLANVTCGVGYNAQLQFSINSTLLGKPFKSDSSLCTWKQFYQVWNSGSNTSATISIVNQNTDPNGNDFALDDISFKKFCKAKDTVKISINVDKTTSSPLICNGDSLLVGGKYRKVAGTYIDTIKTSKNCDSIVTTNLTVGTYSSTAAMSICQEDSIFLQKKYRKTAGSYIDTFKTAKGCDSIVTTNLTIIPYQTLSKNISICQGDSVLLQKQYRKSAGIYYDTIAASLSCDTVVTSSLSILPYINQSKSFSICTGDSIFLQKQYRKTAGTYYDTFASSLSCDTILTSVLSINPLLTKTRNLIICQGDSVFLQKQYRKTAGTYIDTVLATLSCDTIITTNLQLAPFLSTTVDTTICDSDSTFFEGKYYKTQGVYFDTISVIGSCNTVLTINLTTISQNFLLLNQQICEKDSFFFKNKYLSKNGTYLDTVYRKGCKDTIKQLNLTIKTIPVSVYEFRICPGDSIIINGNYIDDDTVFYDTISQPPFCDSVLITRVREVGIAPQLDDTGYFCDDKLAQFDAGNYAGYLWNTGNTSRYLKTNIEGSYWVQVTDTNNCKFNDTAYATERCDPYYYVPSSFSPNEDGLNDYFYIVTSNNIVGLKFQIFDRWGEILFETENKNFVWNGVYKDKALISGTYNWMLTAVGINKEGKIVKMNDKGMITIIR